MIDTAKLRAKCSIQSLPVSVDPRIIIALCDAADERDRLQREIDSGGTGSTCCHGYVALTPADLEQLREDNARLRAALERSKQWIEALKVPQTNADAAWQVKSGMHLMSAITAALASSTPETPKE